MLFGCEIFIKEKKLDFDMSRRVTFTYVYYMVNMSHICAFGGQITIALSKDMERHGKCEKCSCFVNIINLTAIFHFLMFYRFPSSPGPNFYVSKSPFSLFSITESNFEFDLNLNQLLVQIWTKPSSTPTVCLV